MIVGEAWGEEEYLLKRPFCGYPGKELFTLLGESFPDDPKSHALICMMMKNNDLWTRERETWLESASILLTNVFSFRPFNNKIDTLLVKKGEPAVSRPQYKKGNFISATYQPHLDRLEQEIKLCKPNLILCLGATALWAVQGLSGITSVRGAIAPTACPTGLKCLPTFHPSYILRNWSARPILSADLLKAERERHFPEIKRTKRRVLVYPTFSEMKEWANQFIGKGSLTSVDIETYKGQISDIGFSTRPDNAIVFTFINQNTNPPTRHFSNEQDEILAWTIVKNILETPDPKLFQNGLYDLQYIYKMGIRPRNCSEDTMLLHHSLYPELQKGLGFLGSIYTNEASWKLMRHNTEELKKDE